MTLPRLYLPRPLERGALCDPTPDQARYLGTVLRMREGDPLLVFNGTGQEYGAVLRRGPAGILLEITDRRTEPAAGIDITLCQAIPKAEKLDGIVRHATELGVSRIIPFFAERSVPRWPEAKSRLKRERWQKIALEGARQSGRTDIPEIGPVVPFDEMLRSGRPGSLGLILWEGETELGIREVFRDPRHDGVGAFHLAIGPEGGFGHEEIERAQRAGFLSVSLGRRVLRVETAALTVLALVQYEKGALGGGGENAP